MQKQISIAVEQMKKSEEKASLQEKHIKELEEKLKQHKDIIKSLSTGIEKPVQILMPEVSTDSVKILESQIELLKNELIKSRTEVEQFKAKIGSLEDNVRKKEEPKKIPEMTVPAGLQVMPDGRKVYLVEKEDTLQSIAEKVYGNTSQWIKIYKVNSKDVGRGGEIKPGQLLIIP
jgi:nucleoid-associated protein YgaU